MTVFAAAASSDAAGLQPDEGGSQPTPLLHSPRWMLSGLEDRQTFALANRHYSRRVIGDGPYYPAARNLVLRLPDDGDGGALWVTIWLSDAQRLHPFGDAWICSLFRNESSELSSGLVREAMAATRWKWPAVPPAGFLTFVAVDKVRHKRDPGRCFRKAGFEPTGYTQAGLLALSCPLSRLPAAAAPLGATANIWEPLP